MSQSTVKYLMETDVEMIAPDASLQDAACKMRDTGCGFLPVGFAGDRPMGVITDRDLVIRAMADGANGAASTVRDFMTREVCCCEYNDSLEEAAESMNENDVSRLLVTDERGDICGVLTFGRIIRNHNNIQELGSFVARATASVL